MWEILILPILAGFGGAGYWLYDTDVTHVIMQCEWAGVDQDDPTGDLVFKPMGTGLPKTN